MKALFNAIIFESLVLETVLCANILYLAPVASPSHHVWNKVLAYGLIEKGHTITMFTHDEEKKVPKNYSQIILEDIYTKIHDEIDYTELENLSILQTMRGLYDWSAVVCRLDLKTNGTKTLLRKVKNHKFDLIVLDISVGHCFYPMIDLFNIPVVAVSPFLLPPPLSSSFGNHMFPSYVPYYTTIYTSKMSFIQRCLNFIYTYAELLYCNFVYVGVEEKILKQFFGANVRLVREIQKDISLLLPNIDPILDYTLTLPPNIIPVGGLHAKPSNPLPKDLQKIMDNAENGTILFSLGTNVRSDSLGEDRKKAILEAFSRFPHTILWKFESDMSELPKNVITRKWLPQNDILGHPNLKLFVNHGGALSTQEAMYHGVPMVGIPFFADQFTNVLKISGRNLGVQLPANELSVDKIVQAFTEALKPKYRKNMQTISRLFRDQPQSALERAIFWIEYVYRNGKTQKLSPASRDMPAYQTQSLDVLLVLGCVVGVVIYLIYGTGRLFCGGTSTKKKTKTS